jgi:hypothetical protein
MDWSRKKLFLRSIFKENLMNGAVVIQTCDKYKKYWPGFVHYMNKFWDFSIPWPIYFCTEEGEIDSPFYIFKTGKESYTSRLEKILDSLEYDYIFYMLEDYWPISPMPFKLFNQLFLMFESNNWDSLQVSSILPYYLLNKTEHSIFQNPIFEFSPFSNWRFSQQARFWKKDFLRKCLVNPEVSETIVSSSLSSEIACDQKIKEFPQSKIYFYHYFWYPISGVTYRGNFTPFGERMHQDMLVEEWARETYKVNSFIDRR